MSWEHIKRVPDVTEQEIAEALATRATAKELLERLGAVSAPNAGSTKVLLLFARMATTLVDWLDGDLCVEFVADGEGTKVQVLTELGAGLKERVYAPVRFMVPLDEFTRAVERVGARLAPLTTVSRTEKRLTLGATAEARKSSLPPPPIRIAAESTISDLPPPARLPPPSMLAEPPLPVISAPKLPPVRPRMDSGPAPEEIDKGWDE